MKQGKYILITGASGFIGSWLAQAASRAGYQLLGVDLRAPWQPQLWSGFATASLETVDLAQLLAGKTLTAVCHLAGGASVASSVTDPYGDFSSLLPGTARLAQYIARFQPQARLFFFSSAAVHGNPLTLPITETTPVLPISPYGVHKAVAEMLLTQYARVWGLAVSIFRVFSVYGPGLRKQLIWDVSQRLLQAASLGQSNIVLFGTGQESRDFIYVEDLCQAVIRILDEASLQTFQVYNMASGQESSVREVADCLARHLQAEVAIEFTGVAPKGDPTKWQADTTKLLNMGIFPLHSLDGGLKKVADWVITLNN
jgi:UDP-glucose 4-epimerase